MSKTEHMDITLTTTTKKLTKAIINQMPLARSLDVLSNGNVLGYLLNVRKGTPKVVLIKRLSEYYVLETGWQNGEQKKVYLKQGKWSWSISFNSAEDREAWYVAYRGSVEKGEDTYLHLKIKEERMDIIYKPKGAAAEYTNDPIRGPTGWAATDWAEFTRRVRQIIPANRLLLKHDLLEAVRNGKA